MKTIQGVLGEPAKLDWRKTQEGRRWYARWQRNYRRSHPKEMHQEYLRRMAKPGAREERLAWGRAYRRKNRKEVLSHYSGGAPRCSCCGETGIDFLTIDHVNGGGSADHRKFGGWRFFVWLRKNNFPPGFQVLCYNCNMAKGARGSCPHEARA